MSAAGSLKTEQAILTRFQELRNELDAVAARANEIAAELQEHELVLKTLKPLEGGRKCFRLVRAGPLCNIRCYFSYCVVLEAPGGGCMCFRLVRL